MKTKYFNIVSIVLGIFVIVGCTPAQVNETEKSQLYVNEYYNFSLEIPPGPYVMPSNPDNSEYFLIGNENPFTEMSIAVSEGTLDDREKYPGGTLLSEENIEINGVKGKLLHYGYYLPGEDEPAEGDGCPYYILDDAKGHIFTLSLWECIDSPIFEDVVNSFELL